MVTTSKGFLTICIFRSIKDLFAGSIQSVICSRKSLYTVGKRPPVVSIFPKEHTVQVIRFGNNALGEAWKGPINSTFGHRLGAPRKPDWKTKVLITHIVYTVGFAG